MYKTRVASRPFFTILFLTLIACSHSLGQATAPLTLRYPMDGVSGYPPEQMLENCGGAFAGATAIATFADEYSVEITLTGAAPETLYTAWLRLAPGGSPLTGAGSTALANPTAIAELGAATPTANLSALALAAGLAGDDGSGSASVANGFLTDADGNGTLSVTLSFSLVDGPYPFSEFDPSIPDKLLGDTPFAIRIVSHCVDGVGHGLAAGTREAWFDLPAIPVPEPNAWCISWSGLVLGLALRRRRPS